MILKAADWQFQVDVSATREQCERYSKDHCTCLYCLNYYDTVEERYPTLAAFLKEFGVGMLGPIEVMPFEPTLFMACYRVRGQIRSWGKTPLYADGIRVVPEAADEATFHLWVGELKLPWVQTIRPEDVVSPANLPEFMDRMYQVWDLRHGNAFLFS